MGLHTLNAFDTLTCASLCDQASGCLAFNMYIERDPTLDPNDSLCPNPPSLVNYKVSHLLFVIKPTVLIHYSVLSGVYLSRQTLQQTKDNGDPNSTWSSPAPMVSPE
jgi:hypothetical protein